jgi:anthranilate synthase component 1
MFSPSANEYQELSRQYDLIPINCEIHADTQTPITVFWRVARQGPGFLLESVEGGERMARYSFIGTDPYLIYSQKGEKGWLYEKERVYARETNENPFDFLEKLTQSFHAPELPGLPRFYGGAVGYFGYDLVRWLEKIPCRKKKDLDFNDCHFLFCGVLLIFDHVRHTLRVVINSFPGNSPQLSYARAIQKIEEVLNVLFGRNLELGQLPADRGSSFEQLSSLLTANMDRESFMRSVKSAKEYISQGEILQVVLSQRFHLPFHGDPFTAYRRLRTVNPSPYLYLLNFGDMVMVGSSPEMLIRVEGDNVETRPIAGTRPRGRTPEEDARLERELLTDPKERAEHIMLVDLGRNDLGRICAAGSVHVPQFMAVEKYSHVMHLVSYVKGRLAPGRTAFGALKACFPAGTLSGAPKVRAMEIIEELEPTIRGPYGGAIGYVGFNGNLDTAITIRTVIFTENDAYVQTGAGIVADSDPATEYEETVSKAKALLVTLDSIR